MDEQEYKEHELNAVLESLIYQGYLERIKLPNGKVWYKRTKKELPPS